MNQLDIDNRFGYHKPDAVKAELHADVRSAFHSVASTVNDLIPNECREKSLAITALEEAMFWANAALARLGADGERL